MAIEKLITPEIEAQIKAKTGHQTKPRQSVDEVTSSEIRRWCIATMDDNPIFHDKDWAEKTRFGAGCAPGPFPMRSVGHWRRRPGTHDPVRLLDFDDDFRQGDESMNDPDHQIEWPEGVASFHGGDDVEYLQFPRIGDIITVVSTFKGVEEKTGRSGPLAVTYHETVYTNQNGEVLIRDRGNGIVRVMPEGYTRAAGWGASQPRS